MYGCKLCIAEKGLRGDEIDKLPKTEREAMEHLAKVHKMAVRCGSYTLLPSDGVGGIAIRHHACGNTSHHPEDVRQRYCGACHLFLEQSLEVR